MKKLLMSAIIILVAVLCFACTEAPVTGGTVTPTPTPEDTVNVPMEGEFYVKYIDSDGAVDFTDAPKAYIDVYSWSQAYTPAAYAQVIFKEGDGFYVRMFCEEENPRAVYTKFDDPVYLDSCLEFFCDYVPGKFEGYYINTEMNANGAFLTYWAHGIGNYEMMPDKTDTLPAVEAFKQDGGWGVLLHVSLDMIRDIYGADTDFSVGSVVRMNFYKCGSECDIPHYGAWREVELDAPNFHSPQFFGDVRILR